MAIDNQSLESFFNDLVSQSDGVLRNLRVISAKNAIEGYAPANDEIVSGDGTSYYGYEDKDGNYYIVKSVRAGGENTYTYTKGTSGYATAWTARASQSYDTFANTF